MKGVKIDVVKSKLTLTISKSFFDNSELTTEAVVNYPKFLAQLKQDLDDPDELYEYGLNEKLTSFFNEIVRYGYPGTIDSDDEL